MTHPLATATALVAVSVLAACGSMGSMSSSSSMKPMYSQAMLTAPVQVPAGNKVAMETVGVGEITYLCRAKKIMAGPFEWVFAGPDARR